MRRASFTPVPAGAIASWTVEHRPLSLHKQPEPVSPDDDPAEVPEIDPDKPIPVPPDQPLPEPVEPPMPAPSPPVEDPNPNLPDHIITRGRLFSGFTAPRSCSRWSAPGRHPGRVSRQ